MNIMILYKHYGYLEKHNTKHHTIIIIVIIISELIMRGMLSNDIHALYSRRMKSAQPDLSSCHCYVLQLSTLFFRLTDLEVWVYV